MGLASELVAGLVGATIGFAARHFRRSRTWFLDVTVREPADDDETPATGLPPPDSS